jgi:hypothetical protein
LPPFGLRTIGGVVLTVDPRLLVVAAATVVMGLALLRRGFIAYRRAGLIAGTSTSTVASLAVGEVRVSGIVEPAELSLISSLQSQRCVYYRSSIRERAERDGRMVIDEERAVGFRVRDATGSVRVFPRGAQFDVPVCFAESTGPFGDAPAGLQLREGSAIAMGQPDRQAQIAALLTVHRPAALAETAQGWTVGGLGLLAGTGADQSVDYREARIEPGQHVTILGQALPFDQLRDPAAADEIELDPLTTADPEIAADLAAARAAGMLAPDAQTAWGNAAIEGFGIGRPVSKPRLDPAANRPKLATRAQANRAKRTFEIAPDELVLAAAPDAPMTIALGVPGDAAARAQLQFLLGLLGAVVAIIGAVAFAIMLQGGLR